MADAFGKAEVASRRPIPTVIGLDGAYRPTRAYGKARRVEDGEPAIGSRVGRRPVAITPRARRAPEEGGVTARPPASP